LTGAALAPLAAASLFGLVSGFNDGGNLIGSFTSGAVISPRLAIGVLLTSLAGPILIGTAVAQTVARNVIDLRGQGELGFVLITLAPLAVVLASWRVGIPSSMTLALLGAMLGWALVASQPGSIHWQGVVRILVGMPVSVIAGGLLALVVYASIRRLLGRLSNAAIIRLARFQLVTASMQAFAYGTNDMEKTVGLIAVAASFAFQTASSWYVGPAAVVGAFVMFYAGALIGGWRVARRIGFRVLKVRPMQALAQQLASGTVVSALALAGAPVSMTQTIDGGLVGVGAAARASSIRWGIVREMVGSWVLTLPMSVVVAAVLHLAVRSFGLAP
jgi:inorganic phosphate transporter, PiT family